MTRRLRLVVVGAGVAGLEALVALHALAPGRIDATLLEPRQTFRLRALDVGEPFGLGRARRYPVADLARDLGATLVADTLDRVDPGARVAILPCGRALAYDVLLLAAGARPYPALSTGVLFDPVHGPAALEALAASPGGHTAVVAPAGVGWTLPAYETALSLSGMPGAQVTLVTAEREPLEAFGAPAGRMVREELEIDGVHLVTGTRAVAQSRTRLAFESGTGLDVDRIVHLPRLIGPGIAGVPCDSSGFLLAGDDGAVPGADGIYAVGDGTATPIKQGGLAAQQAEAAAYAIAVRAGADVERPPVRPVLRGVLRTRRGLRYMVAEPPGGAGAVEISSHSLWWPPTKVASSWLMPWLTTRDAHRGAPGRPAARSPGEPHGTFRRTVGAGRAVTFDARASGGTGWRVAPADHGVGEPMTLADALALLPGEEHAAALAVHAAALDATCALIATLHGDARTIHDSQRLGRLARLAGRARALAAELGAVRREASPWVEPRGRATMV